MRQTKASLALYDYWRSSAAYRVRIGLQLKGLSYDALPIDLTPGKDVQLGEAYRAVNPQARVPALRTADGTLTQSLAILEWLDENHPTPPLLPADDWARAQVRAFAHVIANDIHPLNNLSVLARLRSQFNADDTAVGDWYRHWISLGFIALEQRLQASAPTLYAFGDTPTLADLCLVPQMYNARRFNTDLTPFPRLVAVDSQAQAHPAFAAAHPDAVKP